ncbi:MAG: family 16 glycoside hydrolase [Bacteroidota bacterium]
MKILLKRITNLSALIFCNVMLVFAQSTPTFMEYQNRSMAEVSKNGLLPQAKLLYSPQKVEVNATGSFHLGLPLMTVPGPGGLNFDITLNYTPGIKVTDEASWVGLGWNLDVGCITRNVEGGMDNTINKTHYRDLDDEKVYSDDQMRDIYSISCPGGSDRAMQFLNGDQYTFMLEELRPWRVTFEDSKHRFIVLTEDGTTYVFGLAVPGLSYNAFGDAIKGRLIYGVPWENPFMQWYLTAIIGPDYVDGGGDPLDPLDGDLPNKGNWIGIRWTYDGTRDFKKYFYREWNLPNYHYGRDISLTSMTYPLYIVTPTYVAKFETEDELWNPISELLDTKWGDFSRGGYGWQWDYNSYFASDGDDPPGVGQVKKRLKNIKLYRNYIGNGFRTITADQTILQQVDFIYQGHDPLYPDQPAPMENGYKEKRSLLKSVIITAGDITIPDYTFDYYDLIGNNDPFNHSWTYDWSRQNYAAAMFDPNYARVGFLGWYNSTDGGLEGKLNEFNYFIGNQTDGKMWNLEKITYPTGGSLVFDYESNCYMVNFSYRGAIDPITGEVAPIVSGAGSRLTSQIVNSGNIDSPSGIYTYEYGTDNSEFDPTFNLGVGRMYADPIDYYSAFPLCGGINCRSTIYPPQNDWYFHQTTHQVLYQQVLEHRPDGSIVKSYYGTAYLCEDIAPSGVGDVTSKMIFDNTMKRRGLLAKREYLSASRENLIKKEEFSIDEMMANSLMLNGPIFSYVKLSDGKITTQDRVVSSVTTEYSYTPGINDAIPNRTIITETNSEGSKKYTYLKYPGEFYQSNYAIAGLVSKNIVDVVLVKWIDDGNSVYAANAVAYKDFGPNDIHNIFPHPYRLFNSRNPEPISDRNYFDTRDYDMFQDWDTDMRFVRTQTFDDYDNFGNLLQSTDANGKTTKYVYDHNNGVRIADFQNLSAGPVYADNFDDGSISDNNPFSWTTTGLWALSNGILRSTNSAYAGNHTVEYQNFTTDVTLHIVNDYGSAANWAGIYFGSISTGDFSNGYILSYQNNGVLKLYKDGENLISVSTSLLPNVWRRLSVSVNGDNVQVYVDGKRFINYKLSSIATSGYIGLCTFDTDTEFDDFRSYPVGALARSYSCDPEKLLVIRATDENSISTNYKYDALGRVHSMLDYRKNPLQEIDYATDLRSIRTIDYLTPNLIKNPSFEDQRMIYRHEQSNNQLLPEEWLLEGCSSISDSMRVTFEKGYHGSCACLFNKGDKNSTFRLIQNIGKLKVGKSYRFIGFLDGGAYIDVYYSDGVHILSSSGTFNFSSPMDYTFTINRDEDVFIALYPSTDINWGAAYDYLGLFAVDDQYTSGSPIDLLPGYSETRNDWLGREIQSIVQQKGGESTSRGWIETNKYYDYLGRLTLSGFPYLSTEYPDTRFELFRNQIAYTDDPLNRIKEQGIDNSSTWGVGTDHSVKYFYSSNADDDPEYSGPGTLYKTRKINENGVSRDTYTDAFNNTIVTIVDPDELSLTTSFEYDIMGKLIRSVDPTELSSNYYYNTLGQMREKTTSDAGGVRYLYDKKGNLRLIKDAAHTITGIPTSIKSTPSSKIPNSGSMVPTISGYNDAIDITGGRNGVYTKLESVSMPRPGRIYIHLQMQYPLNGGLNIKLISGNGTVLLTSATSVYSNSYDVSMYLPKGSYTCEFQSTTAMTTSYSIKCSKWCEYVYNKYDEFDRVIETGEFEAPSEEDDFTQTNADNVTFPTDSCFVSKRFIYDTPSTSNCIDDNLFL